MAAGNIDLEEEIGIIKHIIRLNSTFPASKKDL